jgi:hypothetical protein
MGSYGLVEVDVKNDIRNSAAPNALDSSRRSFLKASLATTALSAVPFHAEIGKPRVSMPPVPTVSDLAGGRFTHRMRDLYSNQTTHNELGYVQTTKSVSGITVTGDFAWLDKRIADKTALDHLIYHATYWKELDKNSHGLGDYGKLENLLEVVSTYLHEAAGMNAGNVSSMRFVADLLERRGDSSRASQLRAEAKDLRATHQSQALCCRQRLLAMRTAQRPVRRSASLLRLPLRPR